MSHFLIALLSFSLGIIVGAVLNDAWKLYRSVQTESTPMTDTHKGTRSSSERSLITTTTLGFVLIAATVALAVVGVMLMVTRNTTEAYSKCTATWQQRFGEAYTARADASIEVTEAMDGVILAVQSNDKKEFDRAVNAYLDVRAKQIDERKANPLPPLPEVLCGERGK